ncbi:MAG: hypothetical protein COA78_07315 [Blastopirellula sp.]|nr:MAG: hypothetical protein COA78_07315 [Blastopirellula sp.]
MDRWVEIEFDCIPLRSIGRLEIPLDASPKYQQHCVRVKEAMAKHGTLNSFFLYNGRCTYHLVNKADEGTLEFKFGGTILTDSQDQHAHDTDLTVELSKETCSWLSEPIVRWFAETVKRSVAVEFDRYISAGDLRKTMDRIEKIQAASDNADGFIGMYL